MIELSWPDKILSPNSRAHWRRRAHATALARKEAYYATKAAKVGVAAGDVPVILHTTLCPPDRRARDMDNAISAGKAQRDGIADALGVNDKHFRLSFAWGEPVKGGKVIVTVEGA